MFYGFERTSSEEVMIKADDMLTYATRGMEPLRGFPEFMRLLHAMQHLPHLKVIVVGQDRQA